MSEKTISARDKIGKYVYGQIAMLTENMKYGGQSEKRCRENSR